MLLAPCLIDDPCEVVCAVQEQLVNEIRNGCSNFLRGGHGGLLVEDQVRAAEADGIDETDWHEYTETQAQVREYSRKLVHSSWISSSSASICRISSLTARTL